MAGISGLPVVDHHCHLSPSGEAARAAGRFREAGGTHLFLATQNYEGKVPTDLDAYRRQFETTERLARDVREASGVVVYVVVAPYPIDLVRAAETLGTGAALDLHRRALDLAGAWVQERRAVALGEVGWPHFPVAPELGAASREAFRHALEVARDVGCPAVVHSPDLDAAGWRELDGEARRAGIPRHRVLKHYTRARLDPALGVDIVPSYLARREVVGEVLAEPGPWFLETDFLDDPARPGAVLDLATVPRRAAAIARRSPADAERLAVPFVRSVEEVYGVRPEVDGR
ncbi:MAG TPA: TatD family hydrolase [Thermoplasmata archaeon]|nr:TatD family hydrolase [Thermoplasmata archaeon]